jgi:hypothetical protein
MQHIVVLTDIHEVQFEHILGRSVVQEEKGVGTKNERKKSRETVSLNAEAD